MDPKGFHSSHSAPWLTLVEEISLRYWVHHCQRAWREHSELKVPGKFIFLRGQSLPGKALWWRRNTKIPSFGLWWETYSVWPRRYPEPLWNEPNYPPGTCHLWPPFLWHFLIYFSWGTLSIRSFAHESSSQGSFYEPNPRHWTSALSEEKLVFIL